MESFVGQRVFFRNPKTSWILGTFQEWSKEKKSGVCKATEGGEVTDKLKEEDIHPVPEEVLTEDVSDLLLMTELHDSTLLHCLKRRYLKDVIYTNIGAILVALNPFNFKIPAYTEDKMVNYLAEGDVIEKNVPHSWAQAHNTYYEMRSDGANQCILVSGESGAGKTEASKIVMKYLAAVSCLRGNEGQKSAAQLVGSKVVQCSPFLEAFGNAKTVRNDNSSRFGKFMRVQFDEGGYLRGVHITQYLLEKSRIVTCGPNERIYHSFYVVLRGRDRGILGLNAEDSAYKIIVSTGKGGAITPNKEFDTASDYDEINASMRAIGLKDTDITALWQVVAGILNFENVAFESDGGEGCLVTGPSGPWLDQAIKLWGVDRQTMIEELNTTKLTIGGKEIVKQLSPYAAMDGRSSVSKTLYGYVFQWLCNECNRTLNDSSNSVWIGLLDIFGFEDFETNSFEQVCINLANETLQGHYNSYIFQKDMDECRAEGINVTDITFPDNSPCLQLLMGKGGVLSLLDEECTLGKGSDQGFLEKISSTFASHKFFAKDRLSNSTFMVHHYAGSVTYQVTGFREKNGENLKDAWKYLMRASAVPFIRELLPAPDDSTKTKVSVGTFFKNQLSDLMQLINSTNPHWIRCVKPHPAKKPLYFDGVSTMNQLMSSGIIGTVKIRKAGYAVRISFADFVARYKMIAITKGNFDGSAQSIVIACGYVQSEAQVGKTRVFMRSHTYLDIEAKKKAALLVSTRIIHAFAKAVVNLNQVEAKIRESNMEKMGGLRGFILTRLRLQMTEKEKRKELLAREGAQWLTMSEMNIQRIHKLSEELAIENERRQKALMEEWKEKHFFEKEGLCDRETYARGALVTDSREEWTALRKLFDHERRGALEREKRRVQKELVVLQCRIHEKQRAEREVKRTAKIERLERESQSFSEKLRVKEGHSARCLERQMAVELKKQEKLQKQLKEQQEREVRNAQMVLEESGPNPKVAQLRKRRKETMTRVIHQRMLEERYVEVKTQDHEIERIERAVLKRKQMQLHEKRLQEQKEQAVSLKLCRDEARQLEEDTAWAARCNVEAQRLSQEAAKAQQKALKMQQDREALRKALRQRESLHITEQARLRLQSRCSADTIAERISIDRLDLGLRKEDHLSVELRDRVPHVDPFVMAGGRLTMSPN